MMRRSPNRNPVRRRLTRNALIYAVVAILALVLVKDIASRGTQPARIRFDAFLSKVEHHQVRTATMFLRDQRIDGKLKDGTNYQTSFAGDGDTLSVRLANAHVKVNAEPQGQSVLMSLLTNVLPFVLIFG